MINLVSPKLTKGRIVNVRTRKYREMMFNPTEIGRTDAWEWGSHKIPGASHPIYSGGSGSDRDITFAIYLDGDRGRSDKRRNGDVSNKSDTDQADLSITDDINFYRQFTFPVKSTSALRDRGPNRVIFVFGSMFPHVECIIKHCETKITQFTPQLHPVKAVVNIQLHEFIRKSVMADDVYTDTDDETEGDLLMPYGDEVSR